MPARCDNPLSRAQDDAQGPQRLQYCWKHMEVVKDGHPLGLISVWKCVCVFACSGGDFRRFQSRTSRVRKRRCQRWNLCNHSLCCGRSCCRSGKGERCGCVAYWNSWLPKASMCCLLQLRQTARNSWPPGSHTRTYVIRLLPNMPVSCTATWMAGFSPHRSHHASGSHHSRKNSSKASI